MPHKLQKTSSLYDAAAFDTIFAVQAGPNSATKYWKGAHYEKESALKKKSCRKTKLNE